MPYNFLSEPVLLFTLCTQKIYGKTMNYFPGDLLPDAGDGVDGVTGEEAVLPEFDEGEVPPSDTGVDAGGGVVAPEVGDSCCPLAKNDMLPTLESEAGDFCPETGVGGVAICN